MLIIYNCSMPRDVVNHYMSVVLTLNPVALNQQKDKITAAVWTHSTKRNH
jgi:hypothetical protein